MKERLNKYFKRSEFACKCGCGFRSVDVELLNVLTEVREHFKEPVMINSGCRCEKHNKDIGGSSRSKHIFGCAADVRMYPRGNGSRIAKDIYVYLDRKYPDTYGLGLHKTFLHIDIRTTKWRKIYA